MALKSKQKLEIFNLPDLPPKKNGYYYWIKGGLERGMGSFGVRITPNNTKTFIFKYRINDQIRYFPLGSVSDNDLSDAWKKAKQLGAMVLEGIDPREQSEKEAREKEIQQKKEAAKGSIKQLFHAYTAYMKREKKRTYKAVLKILEKEIYSSIPPETKAKEITTEQIKLVIAHMIQRGAVTQSNRVRSMLHAAFNYGIKHDNDPAHLLTSIVFDIAINPVSRIPKQTYAERASTHYLFQQEVYVLIDDLVNVYDRFSMSHSLRHILLLCLYTGGQRPFELAASKWSQLNFERKTLFIPEHIAKAKIPCLVPLTDTAIAIFKRQQIVASGSEYLFPNDRDINKHLWTDSISKSVREYYKTTDLIRPFVPRDIRRTCKTLMGELGISKELRDRIQNHAFSDVSSKHYDMYDYLPEKRTALEKWEEKLNEGAL